MDARKMRQLWLLILVVLTLVVGQLGSGWAARHAADGNPAVHVAGDPRGSGSGGGGSAGGGGGGGGGGSW